MKPGVVFFVGVLLVGGWLGFNSWNQQVYVYFGDRRTPAAIPKALDFSNLKPVSLSLSEDRRLLQLAKVFNTEAAVGIELGGVLARNPAGGREIACQLYPSIELVFRADDLAEGGQTPTLAVVSACKTEAPYENLEPIWIKPKLLTQNLPKDGLLEFNDPTPVRVILTNMSSVWPKRWALYSVRLFDPDRPRSEIYWPPAEVRGVASGPLVWEWK